MIFRTPNGLLLPVQSEARLREACPEPVNESFTPNAEGSPITYEMPSPGVHHLKSDFASVAHPCDRNEWVGHWTWSVVMSHVNHGGTQMPRPRDFVLAFRGWYKDWLPKASARAIIGAQFFWNGKAHMVEVCTLSNWGDAFLDNPLVVQYWVLDDLEYVAVDASLYNVGFVRDQECDIRIEFGGILDDLIAADAMTAPDDWDQTATMAWFVGIEQHNHCVGGPGDPAGVADMFFTEPEVVR